MCMSSFLPPFHWIPGAWPGTFLWISAPGCISYWMKGPMVIGRTVNEILKICVYIYENI